MLFTQQIECGECRLLDGTRTRVSQNGTAGLEPPVEPQSLASLAIVNPTASQRILEVSPLSESGAGDEVIMSIAGHVSRAMLSRYSHVRMEAKRHALDEIDNGRGS